MTPAKRPVLPPSTVTQAARSSSPNRLGTAHVIVPMLANMNKGLCLAGDSTASGGGTPRGQSDVAPGGAW